MPRRDPKAPAARSAAKAKAKATAAAAARAYEAAYAAQSRTHDPKETKAIAARLLEELKGLGLAPKKAKSNG